MGTSNDLVERLLDPERVRQEFKYIRFHINTRELEAHKSGSQHLMRCDTQIEARTLSNPGGLSIQDVRLVVRCYEVHREVATTHQWGADYIAHITGVPVEDKVMVNEKLIGGLWAVNLLCLRMEDLVPKFMKTKKLLVDPCTKIFVKAKVACCYNGICDFCGK